jgi:hypothetical protein
MANVMLDGVFYAGPEQVAANLEVWKRRGPQLTVDCTRRVDRASVPWHLPISRLRVHIDAPLVLFTCNHVKLSEL